MDRNTTIGLTLIFALLMTYFYFFAPEPQPEPKKQEQPSATTQPAPQQPQAAPNEPDSVRAKQQQEAYAEFATLTTGTNDTFTIATDKLTLRVASKGGAPAAILVNDHKDNNGKPLPILKADQRNEFSFAFPYRGRTINSKDLYFKPVMTANVSNTRDGKTFQGLILRAALDDSRYIEQVYTLNGNAYDLEYSIGFVGLGADMGNNAYTLNLRSYLPKTEKALENMRQKSAVDYMLNESEDDLGYGADPEKETLQGNLNWVAFKSQFFTQTLVPANGAVTSAVISQFTPEDPSLNKVMEANLTVKHSGGNNIRTDFMLYAGPLDYNVLRTYKQDLVAQMDLGWFPLNYLNIGTMYVFKWMEKGIGNYGLIIFIFAVLIRLLVLPMTYKSFVSMAKMRVLNETPEMKALDEKYKDDQQAQQAEKMNIYRSMGVNPLGGCIPMLAMYPILISMFFFFPQAIELRHQPFLWADDMSSYDSIYTLPFSIPGYGSHISLFCLLMTASTIAYVYYSQKSQPQSGPMAQQMKVISYVMPVMFLFILNNYAAGLSLYYLFSNVLSIIQTQLIRAQVDDKKLLDAMHAKRVVKLEKGDDGKSKIAKWMEEQQKKNQELTRQRQQLQQQQMRGKKKK